jgi:hypothetical protein
LSFGTITSSAPSASSVSICFQSFRVAVARLVSIIFFMLAYEIFEYFCVLQKLCSDDADELTRDGHLLHTVCRTAAALLWAEACRHLNSHLLWIVQWHLLGLLNLCLRLNSVGFYHASMLVGS